jgi:hypothetical protein
MGNLWPAELKSGVQVLMNTLDLHFLFGMKEYKFVSVIIL